MQRVYIVIALIVCVTLALAGVAVFGPVVKAAWSPEYSALLMEHQRLALERDTAIAPIIVWFVAALAVVIIGGLVCWLYVTIRIRYAREMAQIEAVQVVGTDGTGTTGTVSSAGTDTIRLWDMVLGQSNGLAGILQETPEDELLRALAQVQEPDGRQRYSRNRLAGLIGGNKQDALARLRETLGE